MTTLQEYIEKYKPAVILHSDEPYFPITIETYVKQCSLITKINDIDLTVIPKGNITPDNFMEACKKYKDISFDCSGTDWKTFSYNNLSDEKYHPNNDMDKLISYPRTEYSTKILSQYAIMNDFHSTKSISKIDEHRESNAQYPCYYMTRIIDKDLVEIFYVFLYGYNDPYKIFGFEVGAHQSDWEGIVVRVDKTKGLQRVYYKAHGDKDGYWLPTDKVQTIKINGVDRLVFYSARGSHGSYDSAVNTGDIRCCNSFIWPRILCCANDIINTGTLLDTYTIPTLNNVYLGRVICWGKWNVATPYWPYDIKDNLTSNNWFRRLFCFLDCCNPDKYLTNGDL